MTQIGTITGQEIKTNRDGSIAVRLLQVQISNESDIQTVQYMGAAGDDSAPINGDLVQIFSIGPAFKFAVAVEDQNNIASMDAGEKKLYSRDSAGAIAAFINFLAGGNLELNGNVFSAVRFEELETAFNQLQNDFDTHTHLYTPGVGTPIQTAITVASTADIAPAESNTVLLP